jgi:hypothetical protein
MSRVTTNLWVYVQPVACLLLVALIITHVEAKPIIYAQPAHQSPVRGQPDDLLLLPGYGFAADDVVVYQRIEGAIAPAMGVAPVVSYQHLPYSLTIRLPEIMAADGTYVLWVRSAQGEWSNGVLINDARPLWFSPAFLYASQPVAALPRTLKVIGRNLQPAPGAVTRVRLIGPQVYVLPVAAVAIESRLGEHVAEVSLPAQLLPGKYRVEVSRDGDSWVGVSNQSLQVHNDAKPKQTFTITDAAYGSCQADDDRDDASCLLKAITAAAKVDGVVQLGKGQWDLRDAHAPGIAAGIGLTLPLNVSLRGAGKEFTTLVRHAQWSTDTQRPAFTLLGDNEISGFRFKDSQRYTHRKQAAPFIQLGSTRATNQQAISNVVITNNIFDKVMLAIADSSAPIKKLFVTYNDFGAYHADIRLAGDGFKFGTQFRIDDSIIAHNRFFPGSWLDVADRQGALATELGASYRLDFSDNLADGAATQYLNDSGDAHGWRAGFFWHLTGNQEQVLVSANTLSCTGDKVGDGEAIAFDNNGNTFAVDAATYARAATSDSITIDGSLLPRQYNRDLGNDAYYVGHWVQVGDGPGLGQVRKIISYRSVGNKTTLTVAPAWDVIPVADSTRISIGREFWQVYTIGNTIDHRQPLCQKSNRSNPKGGGISLFAQMADSVVAGNRQFDTDGILLQNQFTARDDTCEDCYRGNFYMSFVDVHHNLIDGEYDWNNDCSSSGIMGSLAAGPGSPPLTTNYGLNIADNVIRHADAWRGGAIAMSPSWHQGPAPHRWPLVDSALIQHNNLTDMWSGPSRKCGNSQNGQRTGISLANSSLVWRSVLYANTCKQIPQALHITQAPQTTKLCKSAMQDACECQR